VPAAVVRRFYEKWYRPERMAVIVVGDFDDAGGGGGLGGNWEEGFWAGGRLNGCDSRMGAWKACS